MDDQVDLTDSDIDADNGEFNWTQYVNSIRFQTFDLFLIGAGLFLITAALSGGNFENKPIALFLAAIAMYSVATCGLFIIIKKEEVRPGTTSITGIPAIINGVIGLIGAGCGGLYFLWSGILLLVQR